MTEADPPRHDAPPRKPEPALHLVATPIGAARDITLRALDLLSHAEVLAAEDTRTLRHLLEIHGIALNGRPLIAYHDHNGEAARPRILAALAEGRSVVYASEAGTPLVADPGMKLARAAIEAGYQVRSAPGPSAVLAALCVAGLPTDRFLFAGFPPTAGGARATWLAELAATPATLVIYESPRRVSRLLGEMVEGFGRDRKAAVCRELTKRFEDVMRGTLGELAERLSATELRGEVVVVVDRAARADASADTVEQALRLALAEPGARVRDVATGIANRFGLPRRDIYQMALGMTQED